MPETDNPIEGFDDSMRSAKRAFSAYLLDVAECATQLWLAISVGDEEFARALALRMRERAFGIEDDADEFRRMLAEETG